MQRVSITTGIVAACQAAARSTKAAFRPGNTKMMKMTPLQRQQFSMRDSA